mgnify:CR=1 FL=1
MVPPPAGTYGFRKSHVGKGRVEVRAAEAFHTSQKR